MVAPEPAVARFCQHAIAAIVLVILVVSPLALGSVPAWAEGAMQIAVALAGFLWLCRLILMRKAELVSSPMTIPVIVFTSYVVIRYSMAEVESVARHEMMLAITGGLLFFLVLNNVQRRSQLSGLVVVWVAIGAVLGAIGLWQWASNSGVWGGTEQHAVYVGRASGTFLRPADLAGFLVLVLPLAVAQFFFSRWGVTAKTCLMVGIALMVGGLLTTFSLGGWLGALAAMVVLGHYLLRRREARRRWAIAGGVAWVILVVVALSSIQVQRLATLEPPRLPLWRSAVKIGLDHLWIGGGPGMFQWLYPTHRNLQAHPLHVSNEYLDLFADYGLVGVALVLWLLASYGVQAVRILAARADRYSVNTLSNRYAFVVGGLAAAAGVVIHSTVDFQLHTPANLCILATILAATLTCGVHPSGQVDDETERPGQFTTLYLKGLIKWALVLGLTVVLLLQATRLRKTYPATLALVRAERARVALNWTDAETYYLRAWGYDPRSFRIAELAGDFFMARATWSPTERSQLAAEALRWYDRSLSRNPYCFDLLIKMGRLYDVLGKREQALERYLRAIESDPRNASYHTQLALHYQRWGMTEAAIASYRRAYVLDRADSLPEIQLQQLGAFAL